MIELVKSIQLTEDLEKKVCLSEKKQLGLFEEQGTKMMEAREWYT